MMNNSELTFKHFYLKLIKAVTAAATKMFCVCFL